MSLSLVRKVALRLLLTKLIHRSLIGELTRSEGLVVSLLLGLIGELRRTLVLGILLARRGVLELPRRHLLIECIVRGLVRELTGPSA